MKVLRNFGHMIKYFRVCFANVNPKLSIKIEDYLTIYCFDSLQQLSISCHKSRITFNDFRKPLKKLTDLRIIYMLTGECVIADHIQFIDEKNLPNLNKINIRSGIDSFSGEMGKEFHFENVEYFTLCAIREERYPFSFGKLKHLTIWGGCYVNDNLYKLISNIKILKTLRIIRPSNLFGPDRFHKILESKNVQSNVEEMQFPYEESISSYDILRFVNNCHYLKKLTILMCERSTEGIEKYTKFFEKISLNLGVRWTFQIINVCEHPDYGFCINICFIFERNFDD